MNQNYTLLNKRVKYIPYNEIAIVIGYYNGNELYMRNSIAIEFENPNIGAHSCEHYDYYIIRPAKNYNGLFVDSKNVQIIPTKPCIGKKYDQNLTGRNVCPF